MVNGKTTFADFMGVELLPSELGVKEKDESSGRLA